MTVKQNALSGKSLALSGNALKIIAIIAMTIDHIAWMGIEEYSQAETFLQIFLHSIGRLTAPIMFFLLQRATGIILFIWLSSGWSATYFTYDVRLRKCVPELQLTEYRIKISSVNRKAGAYEIYSYQGYNKRRTGKDYQRFNGLRRGM